MPRSDEAGLSLSSRRWLADSDPGARKRHGQYLTPAPVADALVALVEGGAGMSVLDPGVGTGEILAAVARRFPDARLSGWDIDRGALAAARQLVPQALLELRSALEASPPQPASAGFDLVIANPPYFQLPLTADLKSRFGAVISGRANAFALFFQIGLEQLKDGGHLAFVVPPSMNNGAYFEALREFLVSRASICELTLLEGSGIFEGANTAAQLLVLRKHPGKGGDGHSGPADFVFEHSEPEAGFRRVVFTPDAEALREGFQGRRTLWQSGFEAVTGTVVWNQHRSKLRPGHEPGTVPLLWSRDLRGGTFDPARRPAPPSAEKGGYISCGRRLLGPALLVNRVVGAVGRGDLRSVRIPDGAEFLAENHVNVVRRRADGSGRAQEPSLDWPQLQEAIESPGAADRVRQLTGNTQLSAAELTHLLPL